jgi:protein SCO1/2
MKRLVTLLMLLVAVVSCSRHESEAGALHAGPSIYPLSVTLQDQRSRAIGLDVFRGHPVVISMFYGSCPVACPLIVSHIKEIEDQLSPESRSDLRVLLVSFDPKHDTPAALAAIAERRGLDPARWTLATGSDDDVRQIAAVLGVSYRPLSDGVFAHDSVLTVLDGDGRVLARTDDPNPDTAALRAAIAGTSSQEARRRG